MMRFGLKTKAAKPKFEVRTFDERGLQAAAHALGAVVLQDYRPNIVIGVRTGGYYFADLMMEALPVEAILLPITCRRPSTAKKQRFGMVKGALMALPHPVTDCLRVIEHKMLTEMREARPLTDYTADSDEMAQIEHLVTLRGAESRILVVDDAVDSGATLQAVCATLQSLLPQDALLKTAALTVTTSEPLIEPDYRLYRHVLCRFPWSLDFRAAASRDLRSGQHGAVS